MGSSEVSSRVSKWRNWRTPCVEGAELPAMVGGSNPPFGTSRHSPSVQTRSDQSLARAVETYPLRRTPVGAREGPSNRRKEGTASG